MSDTSKKYVMKKITNFSSGVHEAMLQKELTKDGIGRGFVKFIDMFITQEALCLVLEYCEGGDLSKAMQIRHGRGERYSSTELNDRVNELLIAVQELHTHGIAHRDIKPQNVMIAADGSFKLGDFGLARKVSSESTIQTLTVGTPGYRNKLRGSPSRHDTSLLGKTILELIARRHLKSKYEQLDKLPQTEKQAKLESIINKVVEQSGYHPKYKELLQKMTFEDPEARFDIESAKAFFDSEIRPRSDLTEEMYTEVTPPS